MKMQSSCGAKVVHVRTYVHTFRLHVHAYVIADMYIHKYVQRLQAQTYIHTVTDSEMLLV